uniref:Uncharacterized protein n=1 Tax=Lepeophtheirus salmonis TaxID=72036 RepID=A0A0K2V211_LEPSM
MLIGKKYNSTIFSTKRVESSSNLVGLLLLNTKILLTLLTSFIQISKITNNCDYIHHSIKSRAFPMCNTF